MKMDTTDVLEVMAAQIDALHTERDRLEEELDHLTGLLVLNAEARKANQLQIDKMEVAVGVLDHTDMTMEIDDGDYLDAKYDPANPDYWAQKVSTTEVDCGN